MIVNERAEPASRPEPPAEVVPAERASEQRTPRSILGSRTVQASLTAITFFALFAVYGVWLGDKFLNVDARLLDLHQNVPILLLGLAVMVTLIAGQFDLSVASMATLTAFLAIGLSVKQGLPFGLVLVACLAVGVVGGLVNGLLVVGLRVNTFIATLGTGGLFSGIAAVYSGGTQLTPEPTGRQLPGWFAGQDSLGAFGSKFPEPVSWLLLAAAAAGLFLLVQSHRPTGSTAQRWRAISAAIVVAVAAVAFLLLDLSSWVSTTSWTIGLLLIVGLVLWVLQRLTTFGRNLEATGANPEAARLAGVKTNAETIKGFVLGSVLAALAGALLAAGQGSAPVDAAASFLLPAFAAAFLSTVVFSTGQFTVWGTIIGGTFLLWVSQGLIVGGLPFTWTNVVNGAVLVVAVAVSTVMRRT